MPLSLEKLSLKKSIMFEFLICFRGKLSKSRNK